MIIAQTMHNNPLDVDEDFADRDFLQGKDLSKQDSFGRPPVSPDLNDRNSDMTFMQIDCDYYSRKDCK